MRRTLSKISQGAWCGGSLKIRPSPCAAKFGRSRSNGKGVIKNPPEKVDPSRPGFQGFQGHRNRDRSAMVTSRPINAS